MRQQTLGLKRKNDKLSDRYLDAARSGTQKEVLSNFKKALLFAKTKNQVNDTFIIRILIIMV